MDQFDHAYIEDEDKAAAEARTWTVSLFDSRLFTVLEVIVSVRCLGAIASFLSLAIRIPSVSTRWILVSDICPFLGIYSITTAVGDLLLLGLGRMLSLAQICRES